MRERPTRGDMQVWAGEPLSSSSEMHHLAHFWQISMMAAGKPVLNLDNTARHGRARARGVESCWGTPRVSECLDRDNQCVDDDLGVVSLTVHLCK